MRVLRTTDFEWRGLTLCLGARKVLALMADEAHPHLYRIQYPDGWTSSTANLTRAKDAAYAHARYLLAQATPLEGVYSPVTLAA